MLSMGVVVFCLLSLMVADPVTATTIFDLTNSSQGISPNGRLLQIQLSEADLNKIKELNTLATSSLNSYLRINYGSTQDMSGNPNTAITLNCSHFTADHHPPVLRSFIMDMNASRIILSFSEPIDAHTMVPEAFILQQDAAGSSSSYHQLTGGLSSTANSTIVIIQLSTSDYNTLESTTIARNLSTTFLSFTYNETAFDMAHNALTTINMSNALQAVYYIPDSRPPQLISAAVDMNDHTIALNFSKSVPHSAIDPTKLTLVCDPTGITSNASITLSSFGIVSTPSGASSLTSAQIQFSVADANRLLAAFPCFSSIGTTFISIPSLFTTDYFDNPIIPEHGFPISQYTTDSVSPSLLSFTTNLTAQQIVLTFSKTVNVSSLIPSRITLFGDANGLQGSYSLRTSTYATINNNEWFSTQASISLSTLDLNAIKQLFASQTATFSSISHAYLAANFDAIRDTRNNPSVSTNFSAPLPAMSYYGEHRHPQVTSMSLDMRLGTILVSFSETINVSTADLTTVSIGIPNSNYIYQLSPATATVGTLVESVQNDSSVYTVLFTLSTFDMDSLKVLHPLASSLNTTYFSFPSTFIQDMSANPIIPVLPNNPFPATNYQTDDISPILLSFDINMDEAKLSLTFSETVNNQSFDLHSFTLSASRTTGPSANLQSINFALSPSNPIIQLYFDTPTLNNIKQFGTLCTSTLNCYLSITNTAAADMFGNSVVAIPVASALQARNFTADATHPLLVQYTLDMNAGHLVLTFDEPVNINTLHVSEIQLHNRSNWSTGPTTSFGLTAGTLSIYAINSTVVDIALAQSDINEIDRLDTLAYDQASSYLTLTHLAVTDMAGLSVTDVIATAAMQATVYVADTVAPVLLNYTLDMTMRHVTMSFTKTMRASATVFAKITFVAPSTNARYTLQAGTVLSADNTTVVIALDHNDVNNIELDPAMATSESTTELSFAIGALQDMRGNLLAAVSQTVQAGGYVGDHVQPVPTSFAINMNSSTVVINFDKPVNASSVQPVQTLRLSSSQLPSDPNTILLSTVACNTVNGLQLTCTLTWGNSNDIKANRQLCSNTTNCYLSVSSLFVTDMIGNAVVDVVRTQALLASMFTADSQHPYLVNYGLDMSQGVLLLYFSETVDGATFNASGLTLQSSASLTGSTAARFMLQLDGTGATVTRIAGPNITVTMTVGDMNELKRKQIGLTAATAYLDMQATTVLSMTGVSVMPLQNTINAANVLASIYVPDTVQPTVVGTSLSMNSGVLTLTFSETVRTSTFNSGAVTIVANNGAIAYTLQANCSTTASLDGTVVVMAMCMSDLNGIKLLYPLGNTRNTSLLSIRSSLLSDMSGNALVEVGSGPLASYAGAVMPDVFVADTTSPTLQQFDIDMATNTAVVTLWFDKPINSASLQIAHLVAQSVGNTTAVPGSLQYTLTSGTVTSPQVSMAAVFTMAVSDLNNIKGYIGLWKTQANTFVSFDSGLISDVANNPVHSVGTDAAAMAVQYGPDTTAPYLAAFTVNMTSHKLWLTFSETVSAASLHTHGLIFHNNVSATCTTNSSSVSSSGSASYQLTGGVAHTGMGVRDSVVVVVTMTQADMDAIEYGQQLLTSLSDTYLEVQAIAVTDMAANSANAVTPILDCQAMHAAAFVADVVQPTLTSFQLDLNASEITLWFSKAVSVITFNGTAITLSSTTTASSVSLHGGSAIALSPTSIRVHILAQDMNAIKLFAPDFTLNSNTLLTLSPTVAMIKDYFGNPVVAPQSITAFMVLPDLTGPSLLAFDMNMNTFQLMLTFNEPINASSFDTTGVALHSYSQLSLVNAVQLTLSSFVVSRNGLIATINISTSDMNQIKAATPLALNASLVFLDLSASHVLDMYGNGNSVSNSVPVTLFSQDTVPPYLESYSLDMNSGVLQLVFSETVDATSLVSTDIMLQSHSSTLQPSTETWTLTVNSTAIVPNVKSNIVNVALSLHDMNNLKRIRSLAISLNSTFLSLLAPGLVRDYAGNALVAPIPSTQAMPSSSYTRDSTTPSLSRWALTMDPFGPPMIMTLYFSETVDADTTIFPDFGLQNAASGVAVDSYYLTGGSVAPVGLP